MYPFATYVTGALVLTIVTTLTYATYRLFFDGLSSYPGPKLWALTGNFLNVWQLVGLLPYKIAELHEKYGPVVRIGPKTLSYITGDAWADIYSKPRPQLIKDPDIGPPPPKGIKGLAFTESDEDHARMRRNLSHGFSEKALRDQESIMQRYVDLMMEKLREQCASGPLDMANWFQYISTDIVGDLTFGESFHCLETSNLHHWMKNVFEFLKVFVIVGVIVRMVPLAGVVMWFAKRSKSFSEAENLHRGYTNEKLARRLEKENPRNDFMVYVQRHWGTTTGMSIDELQETCSTLMLGGSETTATVLSGALYSLLKNPSCLEKVVKEIRSAFKKESEIDVISTNRLTYQAAVLQETLRVFPPLPHQIQRITRPEGNVIAGRFVPGGIKLGVTHWACYHSSSNFKDPEEFVPERWLGDERYRDDRRDALKPFSVGPRNCIGYNLAQAQMKLILARFLWNFDMELMDGSRTWGVRMMIYAVYQRPPLMIQLIPITR